MPSCLRPEPVGVGRERDSGLGKLERADDPAAIVPVDCGRRSWVQPAQLLERGACVLVIDPLPALAGPRLGRGRQFELGERCPKVEARPADDDGRPACREDLVDSRMSERRVVAERGFPVERPDSDKPCRSARLVREN